MQEPHVRRLIQHQWDVALGITCGRNMTKPSSEMGIPLCKSMEGC